MKEGAAHIPTWATKTTKFVLVNSPDSGKPKVESPPTDPFRRGLPVETGLLAPTDPIKSNLVYADMYSVACTIHNPFKQSAHQAFLHFRQTHFQENTGIGPLGLHPHTKTTSLSHPEKPLPPSVHIL